MAFKLDKKESAQKTDLVEKLAKSRETLEEVFDAFAARRTELEGEVTRFIMEKNSQLSEARGKLEDAVTEYNEIASAAESFRDNVFNQYETEAGEMSDKWRDSDKGQKVSEWLGHWEDAFPEIELSDNVASEFVVADLEEITFADDLGGDAVDLNEKLNDLPDEPEET